MTTNHNAAIFGVLSTLIAQWRSDAVCTIKDNMLTVRIKHNSRWGSEPAHFIFEHHLELVNDTIKLGPTIFPLSEPNAVYKILDRVFAAESFSWPTHVGYGFTPESP